jgi:hypothetical protein
MTVVTANPPHQSVGQETCMLDLSRLQSRKLATVPFQWAAIDKLYSPDDARALAQTYPCDNFKSVIGNDGEKGYRYQVRSLVHMGARAVSNVARLSPAWQALAADLLAPGYRQAVERLTGIDLSDAPMEVNVFHYGPGAWLGPHLDLKEKLVTHVLYFNQDWSASYGGCLNILRSRDPNDVEATILPLVANSSILVRSESSWHSVSRVVDGFSTSRRSVNVIFHARGSISTMWPPGDTSDLGDYEPNLAAS